MIVAGNPYVGLPLIVAALALAAYGIWWLLNSHSWTTTTTRRGARYDHAWRSCEKCGQEESRDFETGKGWLPWEVDSPAENPCRFGGARP